VECVPAIGPTETKSVPVSDCVSPAGALLTTNGENMPALDAGN
jgi:hypothetical protein